METSVSLMEVGSCADEVDMDVVGGYEVGEMHELVKMAMCYESCADEVDRDVVGGYEVGEMHELVKMAVCYERTV
ncbi:hypothetical protein Tco_1438125 [Tanacetum coccineum]